MVSFQSMGHCAICGCECLLLHNWNGHMVNEQIACYKCYMQACRENKPHSHFIPQKTLDPANW